MLINARLLKELEAIASEPIAHEDAEFNANEWSGGNYGDCYDMGRRNGERQLAVRILEQLQNIANLEARRQLADYAHSAWGGWMRHMFGKSEIKDGTAIIPATLVERWQRQLSTKFEDLPKQEQASDYVEADKIMQLLVSTSGISTARILAKYIWRYLDEISDASICTDRSCWRCRVADIAFELEDRCTKEAQNAN